MKIYVIRHGETAWNKEHKLQGRMDIPLNEFGVALAEKTRIGLDDVTFDIAFTSPLKRAKETAEILLRGKATPLIEDDRLIEISFGDYEGKIYTKDYSEIPDKDFGYFFTRPECYKTPPNGESFEEVLARETEFWNALISNQQWKDYTVLISTHGAALSGLLSVVKKNPIEKFWDCGLHKNCGLSIIEVVDGKSYFLEEAIVLYDDETVAW